ncbi:MAG: hypothetical protein OHK0047_31010 [Leptolyngbyaceae cyanobacterium]
MKWTTAIATLTGSAVLFSMAPVLNANAAPAQTANVPELGASWNYQYDAKGDGSGGTAYDIRAMAMTIRDNKLFVAINGGASLAGVQENGAANGTVSWGDLFFNFSGKKFNDAVAAGEMFAVRFAASNDSPVALGLYSGVQTQSVALQNLGYSSLQQYYNAGFNKNQTQGSALATKDAAFNYYGTGSIQTSIASGTKIGDVNLLTAQALSAMGLNFGANMGSQTFGFSIDKSLLPSSSFLANIYMECGNDGMAYSASAAPEPMTMGGAALGIAAIGGLKRMRRRKEGTAS